MTVLLYRRSLDFTSGAGQLMWMQLRALRGAGERAVIGCERGALRFWARSGTRARRMPLAAARERRGDGLLVDHGLSIPDADLVFVHNLATEAIRHVPRDDWRPLVAAESAFFRDLRADVPLVANSALVKNALVESFGLAPARIAVHHPGFRSDRFTPARIAGLRPVARRALRLADDAPLVGLITSGDFRKRGLDLFVRSAELIAAERADARFLVVGSKSLPDALRAHPLVASGRLLHRPKAREPERWFAALDVFLYPALFEEFGMVVSEAQAVGLPVVTSRAVGAAECLAPAYERWLAPRPEAGELASRALELLASDDARRELASAGIESSRACDDRAYARASLATILAQKRRLR